MEAVGYDHLSVEAAARDLREAADVYKYVPGDGPAFSVDTPPAYVSADHLHVGHAMSYSQPDDNGLPTERCVEQARGVRSTTTPPIRDTRA